VESIMKWVDPQMWYAFINPHGLPDGSTGHCGSVHVPPNIIGQNNFYPEYNWNSQATAKSDCEDWKPDGTGQSSVVSCGTWYQNNASLTNCPDDAGAKYKVWWMQQIPGLNNGLTFYNSKLRNWWEFVGDFDSALVKGRNLYEPLIIKNDKAENNTSEWSCTPPNIYGYTGFSCVISLDNSNVKEGSNSIKAFFKYDQPGQRSFFDNKVSYPALGNANWNLTDKQYLAFSFYSAKDPNPQGSNTPQDFKVKLKDSNGNYFQYTAPGYYFDYETWHRIIIPLNGGLGWIKTSSGSPNLADIDQIDIGYFMSATQVTAYYDGLEFGPSTTTSQPISLACQADINQGGSVDIVDFSILRSCFGQTITSSSTNNCKAADLNKSGNVDIVDYSLLMSVFGQSCTK
jgi:hypothetical protein